MKSGDYALVTGADGFIGSHLVEHLLDKGFAVRAAVQYNFRGSWGWLDSIDLDRWHGQIEIVATDIRDAEAVRKLVEGTKVVYHLAALISIPFSYTHPRSYLETNVGGTLNILDAARHAKCERVLTTSTSEVYGTAMYVPIDEKHPFQAQSPYAASKIAADQFADSYRRAFGLPVTIVRPFNTYGPRQSARAIIPTIITQLLAGYREIKLGSLSPTRDLNFVGDTCEAFVRIAHTPGTIGMHLNIANEKEISIGDLASKLISIINPDARIAFDQERIRPERSEVNRLLGSSLTLRSLVDWEPRVTLEEGLQKTVDWFRLRENMVYYRPSVYSV